MASLYAATEDAAATGRLRFELLRGSERHRVTVRLGDAGDTAARGPAGAAEHRL